MTSRSLLFTALNSNRQITNESNKEDGGQSKSDYRGLFSPSVNKIARVNDGSISGRRRVGRAFSLQNAAIFNSSSPIIIQKKLQFDVSPMSTLSPVSSLALDLNSTNLSDRKNLSRLGESFLDTSSQFGSVTSCRKLSLCSDASHMSDSSIREVTNLSFKSFPPNYNTRRPSHLSCSLSESIQESAAAALGDFEPLSSPSPPSPAKRFAIDEKENCLQGTPKDKLVTTNRRRRRSPLKNISNLGGVNRALCFSSPLKKAPTPAKKHRQRSSEPLVDASPPDDPDPNSQDSGYSESATKCDDARSRDTANVAPRKLNLDSPTKVKFTRLSCLDVSRPSTNMKLAVFPTEIKIVDRSRTELGHKVASADQETSKSCDFSRIVQSIPHSSKSSSPDLAATSVQEAAQGKSAEICNTQPIDSKNDSRSSRGLHAKALETEKSSTAFANQCALRSFVTDTSSMVLPVQESEDDLYMHELYSLEESIELEMPGRRSNSPKLQLGALLSGQVNEAGILSCSDSDGKTSPLYQTLQSDKSEKSLDDSNDGEAKKIFTSKKLFIDEPDSSKPAISLSHCDTEIIVSEPRMNVSSPDSNRLISPMACTPSPQLVTTAKNETRVGKAPCTDMEVSPFNPNVRLPIRRALSLCDVTPPIASTVLKVGASPNHAFKRPLPPSEVSPFLETKRHKPFTATPMLPEGQMFESSPVFALKPLPLLKFDASPSIQSNLAQMESVSSPAIQRQQSDASPELPCNKQTITNSQDLNRSELYGLVVRQFSAPVAVDACCEGEGTSKKDSLPRTVSESHLSIMKALSESQYREEELTGDFGRCLSLPVLSRARNPDIKSITPETMAELITGHYKDIVESYQILDCRYPYEFEGGHIIGAESWHNPQFVVDYIDKAEKETPPTPSNPNKRHILIFHCEFSAERGPRAQRLLRERDRNVNKDRYPSLHFPETYLLEGGYKAFFEQYPKLCVPERYTKMMDADHTGDLKMFRARSKSWALENKQTKGRLWKRFYRE